LQVELCLLDRRLIGLHLRRGRACGLRLVIEILPRNYRLLVEDCIAGEVKLVLLKLGLGLSKISERLIERGLIFAGIDLEQQLAGTHRIAILVVLL
jgi:hypothetical protein